MTDEYDSWRRYEDAEAFKNKLAEIDRLKDRIEKLEAALDEAAFSQTLFDAVVGQRNKATDRIEKLEAALHEWDALIHHQYTGSREAMSDMQYAAQITAALLHGEAPWPETRIEKLEAALREISQQNTLWGAICKAKHALGDFDRKALEGKDVE